MPIRDISAIERALADTSVRESVGRTLSRRPDEIRAVFEPAFRRFFEARLGDRTDVSSLSSEERLTLAAYAKLAYGYGFRIDSRLLREARGRAYLDRAWERIL